MADRSSYAHANANGNEPYPIGANGHQTYNGNGHAAAAVNDAASEANEIEDLRYQIKNLEKAGRYHEALAASGRILCMQGCKDFDIMKDRDLADTVIKALEWNIPKTPERKRVETLKAMLLVGGAELKEIEIRCDSGPSRDEVAADFIRQDIEYLRSRIKRDSELMRLKNSRATQSSNINAETNILATLHRDVNGTVRVGHSAFNGNSAAHPADRKHAVV